MTEYYNKSKYKQRRKDFRNNPTKTEKLLWDVLKGKKLEGYKFRRQYGVGRYVIDFYCVKKKLAIEIDGEVHENTESKYYDNKRDEFIRNFGIDVMRIKSENVENNLDSVIENISKRLNSRKT